MKIKIGVIGCGAIGGELIKYVDNDLKNKACIIGVFDLNPEICRSLKKTIYPNETALVNDADFIIEAASISAAQNLIALLLKYEKDALIMSVGAALAKKKELSFLKQKGVNVYFPSGAICGIDGLRAAALDDILTVTLITRKPIKGLEAAPYIVCNKIKLDQIKTEKVVFQGSAKEAIKAFPKNINVAAMLSICGIGARKTKVKIIASAKVKRNIHEITITAKAANIYIRTENIPTAQNPKTSMLAVLSAKALLNRVLNRENFGS
ncbi:MAG: aspartate dehydrogenase domain-containing protein [Candidatus Omnitrophota bacterium]